MNFIESFSWIISEADRPRYALHVARCLGADPEIGPRASWIQETDPVLFLGRLAAGLEKKEKLWLVPPRWSNTEKDALEEQVEADFSFGEPGDILIPTGGSSGQIKCARHTWDTLKAAADALFARLGMPIGSWIHLPLAHVSGLMPVVRAVVSGGSVRFGNEVATRPENLQGVWTTSIVGTQLKRILDAGETSAYHAFDIVFIGGGPVDSVLLEAARDVGLALAPCYGATETAAMVSYLEPDQFGQGQVNAGSLLPGVSIESDENGQLLITSPANCLGYAGQPRCAPGTPWQSGDLGTLTDDRLSIQGRVDRLIITGGEKVNPLEVESALRSLPAVIDALVVGQVDAEWGERVVAWVVSEDGFQPDNVSLPLARYKWPRNYVLVEKLPLQGNGKVDPVALAKLLAEL
ncbi:MAG: AMP-binding protein [Opitutales bacterium]|nr:AMP-binding protein [Opitutales bacterium]NRA27133.1 AMP-binding protein [Opitutales bacterium]